jgi:hypothetical protein
MDPKKIVTIAATLLAVSASAAVSIFVIVSIVHFVLKYW